MQVNCSKYLYQWNRGKRDMYVFSFGIKEQLLAMLQNVNQVKQRASPQWVASSACDFDQTELSYNEQKEQKG